MFVLKKDIDPLRNDKDWLINNIEAFQDNTSLQLPRKSHGADFDILETNDERNQFVPLELSYARTIHKFQGYQAGQTWDIKIIVCYQATAKLESIFPSLFCTSLSRTTIHRSTAEDIP